MTRNCFADLFSLMKFLLSFFSEKGHVGVGAGLCAAHICHQQLTVVLLERCSRNTNLGPCSKTHGGFLGLQIDMVIFHLTLMMKIQGKLRSMSILIMLRETGICGNYNDLWQKIFQVQSLFFFSLCKGLSFHISSIAPQTNLTQPETRYYCCEID